jgi:GT2 family glycosyltransferase
MNNRIVAVITLMNDLHVLKTVDSLLEQTRVPDHIIVADASKENYIYDKLKTYDSPVDVRKIFGSVGESRNKTIPLISENIILFIDSDEEAEKHWVERITKPLLQNKADYVGGQCIPLYPPETKVEQYIWRKQKELFENYNQTNFQMGNTAWKKEVFDNIGNFDSSIIWGGEDYDINLRATNAGFKGIYAPDAILYHEKGMRTLTEWARKQYKYHTGTTYAYLKNNVDITEKKSIINISYHPLDLFDMLLKTFAFTRGYLKWRKHQ